MTTDAEDRTPPENAALLLHEHGPVVAWHKSTGKAIEAHVTGDTVGRQYWMAVQREMVKSPSRPGSNRLDVMRTAKLLIEQHGQRGAWLFAIERAAAHNGNNALVDLSLQIADAVTLLGVGEVGPGKSRL